MGKQYLIHYLPYKWSLGGIILGTLTVTSYPLTRALDFSDGLHYCIPPRFRFSFVLSRFKGFESMVAKEKKIKWQAQERKN